jgi:tetratricopeptide (TPR) repeat protein
LLYFDTARGVSAETLYKRALAIREKALGPEHLDVAQSLHDLARLQQGNKYFKKAETLYKRALAIREKALGPEHPDVAQSLHDLASLYQSTKRSKKAEPLYESAIAIGEKAPGPALAHSLNNLGWICYDAGRPAEPLFQRALAIFEKLGPDHPNVAQTLNQLGNLYRQLGRYLEAEPCYKRALEIIDKSLPVDHPHASSLRDDYASILDKLNRSKEATMLKAEAITIRQRREQPKPSLRQ